MNRELLDKLCERGILGLVLAILVLTPLAFGGVPQDPVGSSWDWLMSNPFAVVTGIAVAVIALWCMRLWINPRPQLLWPPMCWAVVGFAVYAVIRYLTADIEHVARQEMLQVLVYTVLFLATVNNLHRQESTQIIVLSLVFLAMAISFYAIYQFAMHSNRVWYLTAPYPHRGTGTFISPNNLGGFLEMILPLGLAFTLTSRLKAVAKVFTGYASLAIIAGVAVTGSRGSWLGAALGLVVFFLVLLFHRSYRSTALALLLITLGGGIYFGAKNIFLQSRFRDLKAPSGQLTDDGRFAIWRAAQQLWHENIWWGIGPGHFNSRFGKYRPEIVQASPDRVHNDYLNTLTDWGVVGIIIVAIAQALLIAGGFQIWLSALRDENALGEKRSSKLALVLGASIGLIAILAHSLVDFNMHIPANAIVAVMLMALLTGYLRFATDRYWYKARLGIKVILTMALAAVLSFLTMQTVSSERASLWLVQAKRAPANSVAQIAALEKAFDADRKNGETARAIGEAFRQQSWQGIGNSEEQAHEAMKWFQQAIALNRYDDSSLLRCGMCLDRIFENHDEAFEYFNRAIELDSNSYFNNAYMGWHYVQSGDYAAARPWFLRSRRLEWNENPIADTYLKLVDDRMIEAATSTNPLGFQ
jgi:O-antigen ligase/Flp pilus assembly protein TadD